MRTTTYRGVMAATAKAAAAAAAPSFVRDLLRRSKGQVKLLTLAIVERDGRLLLGLKKQGFGAGYFNGFGGKVEPGETILQAAHRELHEEAGISAVSLEHRGILTFAFDDQPKPWQVHVYRCQEYEGEPTESDEMAPVWVAPDKLPQDKMWADDEYWYPLFLQGTLFEGLFAFQETHKLVWHRLREVQQLPDDAAAAAELLLDTDNSGSGGGDDRESS